MLVDVDRFIDQVSILISSNEVPTDVLPVSPLHCASRVRPRVSTGGRGKCDNLGGGSVFGLANGSGFEGRLKLVPPGVFASGDCMWSAVSGLRDGVYSQGDWRVDKRA